MKLLLLCTCFCRNSVSVCIAFNVFYWKEIVSTTLRIRKVLKKIRQKCISSFFPFGRKLYFLNPVFHLLRQVCTNKRSHFYKQKKSLIILSSLHQKCNRNKSFFQKTNPICCCKVKTTCIEVCWIIGEILPELDIKTIVSSQHLVIEW